MNRTLHALLAGGVLVFSAGCKKPIRIFWPSGPPRSAEQQTDEAVQAATTEIRVPTTTPEIEPEPRWEPFVPVKDEGTQSFIEVGSGKETSPAGLPSAELPNVEFAFDSAELPPAAKAELDKAATFLAANPAVKVVLRGHTDSQGTDEYNLALGSRRAQSVRNYLIGKGIRPDRLETVSFGELIPPPGVSGPEAMARSRRVEFFLYTEE
ncbi:MAG: peptidoglycan-associated lipoprotein [Candidatus Sumerlaeota bacterium]|nr:peptidoglycan-associated lipoprotein [Candidatus Sumerlaeota bacterium]